jgi:hypothetical protein
LFWKRYFFKLQQLERRIDEQRKNIINDLNTTEDLEANWSDDNDDDRDNDVDDGKSDRVSTPTLSETNPIVNKTTLSPSKQPVTSTEAKAEDWVDWE